MICPAERLKTMNRLVNIAVILALASCAPSAIGSSTAILIDDFFADYNKPDSPGASVSIIRDGEVLLSKGYGLADLEARTPATPLTNYRLASVTKQ